MPVVLHLDAIPGEVRINWGAEESYQLQAATLGESMSQLVLEHPQLAFLLDTKGKVRRFINFAVNDAHYSHNEIDTLQLNPNDEVWLVPSICSLFLEVIASDLRANYRT